MKKLTIYILAMIFCLALANNSSAVTIDGTFDETGEWADHNAEEDTGAGTWALGPGYGGQAFDVEYIGAQAEWDGKLFFGLQTGFNLKTGIVRYGRTDYFAGDIAIDTDGDLSFYEYAIDFSVSGGGTPTYSLYQVNTWQDVMYASHSAANPFQLKTVAGPALAIFGGAYGTEDDTDGISHVLEGSFDLSLLSLYTMGDDITIHWTMSCGNDNLEFTTAPVPEPSTYILLGSAMAGLLAWRKKKKKA